MAILQKHKKTKRCVTKKVNVTTALTLFPVAVSDCNVLARKSHTGYLHLIIIHFKRLLMTTETQQIEAPVQKPYVDEQYEALVFKQSTKTTEVYIIRGYGLLDAVTNAEKVIAKDEYLFSISLQPLKSVIDE